MKTTRGKVFLLMLCIFLIAGVAVWAGGKKEKAAEPETAVKTETTAEAAAGPKPVYNWIGAVVEIPYFIDHKIGVELGAKTIDADSRFLGPTGYDIPAMIDTIEQAIVQKPAGIEIIGFVEELAPVINKAIAAGIPVVTLDADTATSDRFTFIGTGNYGAGRMSARLLAELIGGTGKVAVTSVVGQ